MEEQDLREFDGERPKYISYYVHEAEVARLETHSKRWMIAALIAFLALIGTNAWWIIYENQFEDVRTTVTQEATAESGDAIVNGDRAGAVFYGDSEADNNDEKKSAEDGR